MSKLFGLRCACGSDDVVAIKPGYDPPTVTREPAIADEALCETCLRAKYDVRRVRAP